MIESVKEDSIAQAAAVHSAAWQASHKDFCAADFVARHTPERQEAYLREKMRRGTKVFLLTEERPLGLVSVTGSLIEDLYVLPEDQNRGYGTRLLRFAIRQCEGVPTLWILENNQNAARLYRRLGFRETGRVHTSPGALSEIEFALCEPSTCQ